MSYPDRPPFTLIVGGVDVFTTFGLILADGYTLEPPEPKVYTVDIPGADGQIDLTEALTGHTAYNNRTLTFPLYVAYPQNFEQTKTAVSNFLHGRAYDFKLTFDPEYTYHGRFTVTEYASQKDIGQITIEVDCDPYKSKGTQIYKLNAAGGKMFRFQSGRRPVRPVVETSATITVSWQGNEITVPAGTYRLNDVLFTEGQNELYINSLRLYDTIWSQLGEGGENAMTWEEASKYRWDELARINLSEGDVPQSWSDLYGKTWEELSSKRWMDLDWRPGDGDVVAQDVYLTYEWEDL